MAGKASASEHTFWTTADRGPVGGSFSRPLTPRPTQPSTAQPGAYIHGHHTNVHAHERVYLAHTPLRPRARKRDSCVRRTTLLISERFATSISSPLQNTSFTSVPTEDGLFTYIVRECTHTRVNACPPALSSNDHLPCESATISGFVC